MVCFKMRNGMLLLTLNCGGHQVAVVESLPLCMGSQGCNKLNTQVFFRCFNVNFCI